MESWRLLRGRARPLGANATVGMLRACRSMAGPTSRWRSAPWPLGLGAPLRMRGGPWRASGGAFLRPLSRGGRALLVVTRESTSSEAIEAGPASDDGGPVRSANGSSPAGAPGPSARSSSALPAASRNGLAHGHNGATSSRVHAAASGGAEPSGSPTESAGTSEEGGGQDVFRWWWDQTEKEEGEEDEVRLPEGRWDSGSYFALQRTFEIWSFAFAFFMKYQWVHQKLAYPDGKMTPEAMSKKKTELAVWLREGLCRLGPTFIKVGQQFSTRVDVLSPEFIRELARLQDDVPSFSTDKAIEIMEESWGKKVSEVFEDFTRKPLAAASLGQVHLAKLNGQTVVVKVQRPGLRELFEIDLKNVYLLAQIMKKLDSKGNSAARDWVAIYKECARILYEEIDYVMEGHNAEKFRTNFEDTEWVKVPKIYWEHTTKNVLVMEYVPGTKINNALRIDSMGLDRRKLARLTVESYLQQILRHGFFHADPHPGNVACDSENGGRLIYYDFGMMGSIPGDIRTGLFDLFYGVYQKNVDKCIEAIKGMGVLVPGGDMMAIRRTGEYFLQQFEERLQSQRKAREEQGEKYTSTYKKQMSKEEVEVAQKKILANIGEDLLITAADQPFRFPAEFTFVVRAFSVLDGIGKSLDPRFDISEIAAPYAREFVLETRPQIERLKEDLKRRADLQARAVVNLFQNPNRIQHIAEVLERLERGDVKLRVRAVEAERALVRVEIWQALMVSGLMASMLVNVGTALSLHGAKTISTLIFLGAAAFGCSCIVNIFKLKNEAKREKMITGLGAKVVEI
eukprot:evm.model.scf_2271.1 EVM.evm.TU.scf_2271.1   scf_2271:9698-15573(+)